MRGSTIEEQTRLSIQTLEKILTAAGSGLSDLLQVQVFLNDIGADYDGFDATYKQMIPYSSRRVPRVPNCPDIALK